ncbi:MAG: hypothetical protein ACJA0H_000443, partial [Francisellaceae bacterium]
MKITSPYPKKSGYCIVLIIILKDEKFRLLLEYSQPKEKEYHDVQTQHLTEVILC